MIMKNTLKSIKYNNNQNIFNYRKSQSKIIDFKPINSNYSLLKIKINHINNDNYKITLEDGIITLFLTETIEFNKPLYSHNFKTHGVSRTLSYDKVTSFDFTLPEKNYYLVEGKVLPYKNILEITLGKIYHN